MRESQASTIVRRSRKVNQNRMFDLLLAIFVLYFLYFLTGLLYENMYFDNYSASIANIAIFLITKSKKLKTLMLSILLYF